MKRIKRLIVMQFLVFLRYIISFHWLSVKKKRIERKILKGGRRDAWRAKAPSWYWFFLWGLRPPIALVSLDAIFSFLSLFSLYCELLKKSWTHQLQSIYWYRLIYWLSIDWFYWCIDYSKCIFKLESWNMGQPRN